MFVQRAVDALGEVLEARLALSELALGSGRGRGSEEIAQLQLSVPAPESLEALFLLVELGEGEFLLGEFALDFGLVLDGFGDELGPFFLATCGEEGLQALCLGLVATAGFQDQRVPGAALDQCHGALEPLFEGRGRGQRPDALAERERTDAPQLAPHGHPMTGRVGRQPHRQDRPAGALVPVRRHARDCSGRYASSRRRCRVTSAR